jgi:hypothetical protein
MKSCFCHRRELRFSHSVGMADPGGVGWDRLALRGGTQSVVHGPAVYRSPGCLLGKQLPIPLPRHSQLENPEMSSEITVLTSSQCDPDAYQHCRTLSRQACPLESLFLLLDAVVHKESRGWDIDSPGWGLGSGLRLFDNCKKHTLALNDEQ